MPIVHECAAAGCKVLTMGDFCLEHEGGWELDAAVAEAPLERDDAAGEVSEGSTAEQHA
jgi:hypothetical protein